METEADKQVALGGSVTLSYTIAGRQGLQLTLTREEAVRCLYALAEALNLSELGLRAHAERAQARYDQPEAVQSSRYDQHVTERAKDLGAVFAPREADDPGRRGPR